MVKPEDKEEETLKKIQEELVKEEEKEANDKEHTTEVKPQKNVKAIEKMTVEKEENEDSDSSDKVKPVMNHKKVKDKPSNPSGDNKNPSGDNKVSKSKKKVEETPVKRGRGRPKGSPNKVPAKGASKTGKKSPPVVLKKMQVKVTKLKTDNFDKKVRGRPKGASNKEKPETLEDIQREVKKYEEELKRKTDAASRRTPRRKISLPARFRATPSPPPLPPPPAKRPNPIATKRPKKKQAGSVAKKPKKKTYSRTKSEDEDDMSGVDEESEYEDEKPIKKRKKKYMKEIDEKEKSEEEDDDDDEDEELEDEEEGDIEDGEEEEEEDEWVKIECDICGKTLRQNSYKQHMKTHSGDRPYECDMCHSHFTRRSDVTRHIKAIHKQDKPFKCCKCQKDFSDKKNLKLHLLNHDKTTFYTCKVCGFKFGKKEYYLSHIRFIHPQPQAGMETTVSAEPLAAINKPITAPRVRKVQVAKAVEKTPDQPVKVIKENGADKSQENDDDYDMADSAKDIFGSPDDTPLNFTGKEDAEADVLALAAAAAQSASEEAAAEAVSLPETEQLITNPKPGIGDLAEAVIMPPSPPPVTKTAPAVKQVVINKPAGAGSSLLSKHLATPGSAKGLVAPGRALPKASGLKPGTLLTKPAISTPAQFITAPAQQEAPVTLAVAPPTVQPSTAAAEGTSPQKTIIVQASGGSGDILKSEAAMQTLLAAVQQLISQSGDTLEGKQIEIVMQPDPPKPT